MAAPIGSRKHRRASSPAGHLRPAGRATDYHPAGGAPPPGRPRRSSFCSAAWSGHGPGVIDASMMPTVVRPTRT